MAAYGQPRTLVDNQKLQPSCPWDKPFFILWCHTTTDKINWATPGDIHIPTVKDLTVTILWTVRSCFYVEIYSPVNLRDQ